jgi:hypothetical protein
MFNHAWSAHRCPNEVHRRYLYSMRYVRVCASKHRNTKFWVTKRRPRPILQSVASSDGVIRLVRKSSYHNMAQGLHGCDRTLRGNQMDVWTDNFIPGPSWA